ncbi:MAG: NAD-dependent epimerase/dehydratase family protein [Caldilineaceae bacterium]|nr:NAD-dependent epimerase/dehydratase family protein [Caldilineaceae bacterium]
MNVLVTGGAGFIGSHIVDALLAAQHRVLVVDNLHSGHRRNLAAGATFVEADICDADAMAALFARETIDAVCHQAALANVRTSMAEPVDYARVNILGSLTLLELARENGCRKFVFASTGGAVYGEGHSDSESRLPFTERSWPQPKDNYGANKLSFEYHLDLYHQNFGLKYAALRYPNVYGPRQDSKGEAGVVAIFTGAMLEGKPTRITGDGKQIRDFTYVGDIARANRLALESDAVGIFNVGTGEPTDINRVHRTLAAAIGYEQAVEYIPRPAGEVLATYLDSAKARAQLVGKPRSAWKAVWPTPWRGSATKAQDSWFNCRGEALLRSSSCFAIQAPHHPLTNRISMHIAINGWFLGQESAGSGQYLHHLLEHLPRHAPPSVRFSLLTTEASERALPGIDPVRLSLPGLPKNLAKLWWEQVTVPRAARRLGADVLWVPYWAAPLWQPCPVAVTIHDLIPLLLADYRGGRLQRGYTALVGHTARRAASVIAVSAASAHDVIHQLGVPEERVHVVHHGPNQEGAPAPDAEQLRQISKRYQLPERFFLYLGGFDLRKICTPCSPPTPAIWRWAATPPCAWSSPVVCQRQTQRLHLTPQKSPQNCA